MKNLTLTRCLVMLVEDVVLLSPAVGTRLDGKFHSLILNCIKPEKKLTS